MTLKNTELGEKLQRSFKLVSSCAERAPVGRNHQMIIILWEVKLLIGWKMNQSCEAVFYSGHRSKTQNCTLSKVQLRKRSACAQAFHWLKSAKQLWVSHWLLHAWSQNVGNTRKHIKIPHDWKILLFHHPSLAASSCTLLETTGSYTNWPEDDKRTRHQQPHSMTSRTLRKRQADFLPFP